MPNLNSNDYKILQSIVETKENRGLSRGRGTTKKQIVDKTGFSYPKIYNTVKVLLELGFIDYAVKKVRADAFYITTKGYEELKELKKNIL